MDNNRRVQRFNKKISPYVAKDGVILLDCLTNMVTNLMIMDKDIDWDNLPMESLEQIEKEISQEVNKLFDYFREIPMDTVIVSNELGMGVIPPYPLGRYFRDICGKVNQMAGKYSDEAYMAVSGLQLKLK